MLCTFPKKPCNKLILWNLMDFCNSLGVDDMVKAIIRKFCFEEQYGIRVKLGQNCGYVVLIFHQQRNWLFRVLGCYLFSRAGDFWIMEILISSNVESCSDLDLILWARRFSTWALKDCHWDCIIVQQQQINQSNQMFLFSVKVSSYSF